MLTQTCYTVHMVDGAVLLLLGNRRHSRSHEESLSIGKFAVREFAVAKSSSSDVTMVFQRHMYKLCSSVRGLTKHFSGYLA